MAIPNTSVKRFIEDVDTRVSVGLNLPLGLDPGSTDGNFRTTKTTVDAIKEDIKLLLMTQKGERLMQPGLGMNIRQFLFEQITEDIQIQIENDIVDTFNTWLPFVELREININKGQQDLNRLGIDIKFNIRNAPTELESVGVILE
tara:strand:- start:2305 stop:2739 length:435 start_codon:yes stop_codon:yes gene_type:complete